MTMITKQEVEHIAKLARLDLDRKEIKKMEKELSSILGYFEKLKEVDVSQIEPTSHPVSVKAVVREDKVKKQKKETVEKLLKAAPERKGRHIKVKNILESKKYFRK